MSKSEQVDRRGLGRRIAIAAVVLVLLVTALLLRAIEQPREQAAELLQQVQALEIGQTPYSQIEQLVAEYSGRSTCYEDDCSVRFDNAWMHRLGLAPMTQLQVMLHRRESRLSGINLAMMVTGATLQQPPRATAMVFDAPPQGDSPAWRAVITDDANGRPVKTFVQISTQAQAEQRKAAYGFNLSCLTRRGGCQTSRELLPGVWKNAQRVEWVR